jgi:putative mRNA 3-end processing factor
MKPLIVFTAKGLYCPAGDFYIDPWRPVQHAIVSHAHADHAFSGMQHYYATPLTTAVMRHRLGADIDVTEYDYGQQFSINGVGISLHPAGHVPGSAQIRIEHAGRVWVATGDYKLEDDGLSTPFETIECEGMITEATFGLPIYRWRPQADVQADIMDWWRQNIEAGKTSLLYGYSFGKAQRLLHMVGYDAPAPIYGHGAVYNVTEALRGAGLQLPDLQRLPDQRQKGQIEPGSLVLAPPSAAGSAWIKRFNNIDEAFVSGWMSIRSSKRSRAIGRGFTMSDHADWPALLKAIEQSKATFVQPFCGSKDALSRYLREEVGLNAPDAPAGRYNAPTESNKDAIEGNE